jgi:hypothetical protein
MNTYLSVHLIAARHDPLAGNSAGAPHGRLDLEATIASPGVNRWLVPPAA